jgi:hypothetical protein
MDSNTDDLHDCNDDRHLEKQAKDPCDSPPNSGIVHAQTKLLQMLVDTAVQILQRP